MLTLGDIRRLTADMPDEAEVWIEYPYSVGVASGEGGVLRMRRVQFNHHGDEADMIDADGLGFVDGIVCIFHHY